MSLQRFPIALATALALVVEQTAFAATGAEAANRLQQQQLQDTLELNLQQGASATAGSMSAANAQQLGELHLTQRMQQQQLEQQQLVQQQQEQQLQRIDPNINGQAALQQQQFGEQRQLQLQQFNTEQSQLMNTMKPQPLQPPTSSGLLP
ncbi:MAG: hypothetical protein ACXWC0_05890 [Burkholderiales bacterium]